MIFSILLTTVGIALLYKSTANTALNLHGVAIVLLSALLYACYIVGVKNNKTVKHIKSDKLSFYVMLFWAAGLCSEFKILHTASNHTQSVFVVMYNCACCISDDNFSGDNYDSHQADRLNPDGQSLGL